MVKENEYLLTNQEILGGLKSALARGQTLKKAMMSFYQAGYKKEEIEDAARAYLYLQRGNSEVEILAGNKAPKQKKEDKEEGEKSLTGIGEEKKISKFDKTKIPSFGGKILKDEQKKVVQKISNYGENKDLGKFRSKTITSILVITLIVLVGILALVFLFKAELINFINGLFG